MANQFKRRRTIYINLRFRIEDIQNWIQWAWLIMRRWGPACGECGKRDGLTKCFFNPWGKPVEFLCDEHIDGSGFCPCCGLFSAGIDSFDFGRHAGLCENCADDFEEYEDDYEEDYDYYKFGY